MFPQSLHKNIRELDRQISLLETECENMEFEKKEFFSESKINSKSSIKKLPNKPFTAGPMDSTTLHSPEKIDKLSFGSKTLSCSCSPFKEVSKKVYNESEKSGIILAKESSKKSTSGLKKTLSNDAKYLQKNKTLVTDEDKSSGNENKEICYDINEEKPNKDSYKDISTENRKGTRQIIENTNTLCDNEARKLFNKESISSIRKISQSNDKNLTISETICDSKQRKQKILTWSDIFNQKTFFDNSKGKKNKGKEKTKNASSKEFQKHSPLKLASEYFLDKKGTEDLFKKESERENRNDKWVDENTALVFSLTPSKKRRSVRTRINCTNDIPVDINTTKGFQEKEIQCMLWNEEREKDEFLTTLNNSIRTLYLLITELKTESSKKKRNYILNDIQNTLMAIPSVQSTNALNDPLNVFKSLKAEKFLDGEEYVAEMKKTVLRLKKICEQLFTEKSALYDELNAKNCNITEMKNNEKEYLSLISNLNFNLEKIKKEAEEGAHVKRDLIIIKNKLQEETKVTEALKQIHWKMQELIENYVLENDKLRTQVRLAKLESQKYNFLLTGKEMEIKKYKEEILSIQKQISEQLNLFKTKALKNQVKNVAKILKSEVSSTEANSLASDTEFEKTNFSEILSLVSTKTSLESTRDQMPIIQDNKNQIVSLTDFYNKHTTENHCHSKSKKYFKKYNSSHQMQDSDKIKDADFARTSYESDESDTKKLKKSSGKTKVDCNSEMEEISGGSQNLKSSIDEIIQDMRMELSENCWQSSQNSFNTSVCTLITNSSQNTSVYSQKT